MSTALCRSYLELIGEMADVPTYASFFGFMGAAASIVFSCELCVSNVVSWCVFVRSSFRDSLSQTRDLLIFVVEVSANVSPQQFINLAPES